MPKILGYMLTWTTYGSWLQGDPRGYIKDGKVLGPDPRLADANRRRLSKNPVKLSEDERCIVADAIREKAEQLKQTICALSVSSNHVHIVAENTPMPVGRVVATYKTAAQVALRKRGLSGRLWTKGFDKRFCFDSESLETRIRYVQSHNH